MKIAVPQNIDGVQVLRRSGYGMITNRSGQQSFVRRLARNDYPRFHVYYENGFINLHLDQKQASYEGTSAHSGEYDGEVVESEGSRISDMIQYFIESSQANNNPPPQQEEKKGFWNKFF